MILSTTLLSHNWRFMLLSTTSYLLTLGASGTQFSPSVFLGELPFRVDFRLRTKERETDLNKDETIDNKKRFVNFRADSC